VASLAFLVLAGLGLGWFGWRWYTAPVPPEIPLDNVEPAVAEAVQTARQDVLEDRWSAAAWGKLGMVLEAHEFTAQAAVCYARAEDLDPKDLRWPYFLGMLEVHSKPAECLRHLRRAVALSQGEEGFEPRMRLAKTLLDLNHRDEAEKLLGELLKERPDFFPIHLYLGQLALDREDFRGSLRFLRRAAQGKATQKLAYRLLAQVYGRLGQAEEAARARYATTRVPEASGWYDSLRQQIQELAVGSTSRLQVIFRLQEQGLYKEALPLLLDLVQDFPNDSQYHLRLGLSYQRMNRHDEAEKEMRRALDLDPNSVNATYSLGMVLVERAADKAKRFGDREFLVAGFQAAAPYFRKVIRLKSDHARAHLRLGEWHRMEDREAKAWQEFQTALRCQPGLPEAHTGLAELLLARGRNAEALVHLDHALLFAPKEPKPLQLLAQMISRATLGP
jgi:tetratricopeptide (TPR) repeat protein